MGKADVVMFNGTKFYRYPKSKIASHRRYYQPGRNAHNKGVQSLHREVWRFHNGEIPSGYAIHHKDHNPLNNEIWNLELLSISEHQKNHCAERLSKNKQAWRLFQKNGTAASIIARKNKPPRTELCVVCKKKYTTNYPQQRLYCGNTCRSKNQKLAPNKKFRRQP